MNGHSINVTGAGFRGGGGVQIMGGADNTSHFVAVSPTDETLVPWLATMLRKEKA